MAERTITVNGFSKSHSMTGYRLGYTIAPLAVAKEINKVQSQLTSCASSIAQQAALAGLKKMPISSPGWMTARIGELQAKRDLAHNLLLKIPHVTCDKPSGAFYLFPNIKHYIGKSYTDAAGKKIVITGSHRLCVELLRQQQTALVAGEAFGTDFDHHIRLSYAASTEVITESITRLGKFLATLKD